MGIDADGTTLGTGLITFGSTNSGTTRIRTDNANTATRVLDAPGGWLLKGHLEIGHSFFGEADNLTASQNVSLRINGNGRLASGMHTLSQKVGGVPKFFSMEI